MSTTGFEGTSAAASASDLQLVLPGRGTPAGAGVGWIGEGWKLFVKAPLMWIVAIVIVFVLAIVVSLVPFIGTIAFQLLNPVFSAGFVIACRSLERGDDFELEHLFAGFKAPHLASLLIVGLLFLAGWIAILLIGAVIGGFSVLVAFVTSGTADVLSAIAASSMTLILAVLVVLALSVPLLAAYWFAPALVIMHGMGPWNAMKASFFACFRNFIPFVVYGIVMMLLALVAAIPFGLGFLVWVPLAIASTYAAYREIFTEEKSQGPVAARMV